MNNNEVSFPELAGTDNTEMTGEKTKTHKHQPFPLKVSGDMS